MEFTSFDEALVCCLNAAEGSPEQAEALAHCLKTAPPDLRLMLANRLGLLDKEAHGGSGHIRGCGCGCNADES